MDSSLIQTIAVYALPVIFAITLHEAAHGYAARLLGDNTAYVLGRVSLNPMRHIDPVGTLAIPLILYFVTSGAFMFGYAKPVPVAFGNLRNPRWGSLWVAAAGPASNFVQALLWGVIAEPMPDAATRAQFRDFILHWGRARGLIAPGSRIVLIRGSDPKDPTHNELEVFEAP